MPTLKVDDSIALPSALVGLGFAASNGEAKRKVAEGAVRVDDEVVTDPQLQIRVMAEPVKISLGKKKHGLLTT